MEVFLYNSVHDEDKETLKGASNGEQIPKHETAICSSQTRKYPVQSQQNKDGKRSTEMGHLLQFLLFSRDLKNLSHYENECGRVQEHQKKDWG